MVGTGSLANDRFYYGGPEIESENHGCADGFPHGLGEHVKQRLNLANRCFEQLTSSHALFAWIDREGTIGTIAEIGAARALQKPIFIAFKNQYLSRLFYFVTQLSDAAVVAPSAASAWEVFKKWMRNSP